MSKTSTSRLSELMTIRDILMGEIIEEYNERFEKLEAKLVAQQETFNQKEEELNNRISTLKEGLNDSNKELQKKIMDKGTSDKEMLGSLFLSLGQQLKEK